MVLKCFYSVRYNARGMNVKTLLAGLVIGLLLGVYVYQEVLDDSEILDDLRDAYDELGDTYGDLVTDF